MVAAPAGVAVNSARQPAAGWPAGSARGAPAPSVRVRSAPARSTTSSPGDTGAAACSPHPARRVAAARMREAASGRMHPGYTPGARRVPVGYSPYERPMTSSMISSVPAPMRFRRMSRHTRSTPYSFM